MGSEDDPDAATDGSGRVRRVEGLTVADASLMPTIPSSNIHLPTLMVAERIAEFLQRELGLLDRAADGAESPAQFTD
jgi:choline dehydrogenase-like flavoprotein